MGELGGDRFPIDALRLLGVPLHEPRGVGHLGPSLLKGLPHLQGHEPGQGLLVLQDALVPAPQDPRPLIGRGPAPEGEGRHCLL